MNHWKQRLTNDLEPVLGKPDPRPELSAYHNLPCAIFHHPPEDELELRHELTLLATRLEGRGKRVTKISLADLMFEALAEEAPVEDLIEAEKTVGVDAVVETVHGVLSEYRPLGELVLGAMPADGEPTRDVVFLVRAGALFPFVRTSALLEQVQGRIELPTVLFYPGVLDGPVGLRFMGVLDPEHNYRPKMF